MELVIRKVKPLYKTELRRKYSSKMLYPLATSQEYQVHSGWQRSDNPIEDEYMLTPEAYEHLERYFQFKPPAVGDRIFVDFCYKIVKVFFNLNHNHTEIWLAPDAEWLPSEAPLLGEE